MLLKPKSIREKKEITHPAIIEEHDKTHLDIIVNLNRNAQTCYFDIEIVVQKQIFRL